MLGQGNTLTLSYYFLEVNLETSTKIIIVIIIINIIFTAQIKMQ